MFDKYMICEDTVRNVSRDGRTEGFQFGARLPYYLSLIHISEPTRPY